MYTGTSWNWWGKISKMKQRVNVMKSNHDKQIIKCHNTWFLVQTFFQQIVSKWFHIDDFTVVQGTFWLLDFCGLTSGMITGFPQYSYWSFPGFPPEISPDILRWIPLGFSPRNRSVILTGICPWIPPEILSMMPPGIFSTIPKCIIPGIPKGVRLQTLLKIPLRVAQIIAPGIRLEIVPGIHPVSSRDVKMNSSRDSYRVSFLRFLLSIRMRL